MADRAGAAFAAILGERELAEGAVTLRRLADGVQETIAMVRTWSTGSPGSTTGRTRRRDDRAAHDDALSRVRRASRSTTRASR